MERMYDRIKRMTTEEMERFIYWVYLCGNRDGCQHLEDSPGKWSFFGGHMLTEERTDLMPNDSIDDLWDMFEQTYGK